MSVKERIGLQLSKWMYFKKASLKRNALFYKQLVKTNDLCFDIGANIGGRTKTFLDLGAKVIAVEPQSIFYNALQKQFSNNNNFKVLQAAVGAINGTLKLKISTLFPMVSTLANQQWINTIIKPSKLNIKYDKEEIVNVFTLDDLIEKYGLPNFCKLDVEGFELAVLKGLSHKIPLICFEFFNYDMNNTLLCLEELKRLGFKNFNWSKGEQQQFKMDNWFGVDLLLKDINKNNDKKFSGDIYAK